jgi:hypothetical protein
MMFVLPLCAIAVEHFARPDALLIALVAKWFVFWAVGVRLLLAGVMQLARPKFTAQNILGLKSDEALPLVRELGIANLAAGIVGIASIAYPSFVFPIAIWAVVFYGGAAVGHAIRHERSAKENVAMLTDLFAFLVLAVVVGWKATSM